MAFTKVVGPGIHTLSNILSHNINSSGIITATKFVGPFDNAIIGGGTTISSDGINVTGIVTATGLDVNGNGDISGNLVVGGNLTANGDFTTLNTTLREVELLRVDAQDDNVAAGIITQRGTGDILNLYDGSTEVFSVADGGATYISNALTINRTTGLTGARLSISNVANFPGIGIQLNQNTGITTSLTTFNSAGQHIFDLAHDTDSTPDLIFKLKHSDTGAPVERARITSAGRVQVKNGTIDLGTADTSSGHINSAEVLTFNIDTDNDDTNRYFAFYKNGSDGSGTELVRIKEDGNVGINTDDPTEKLDVRGYLVVAESIAVNRPRIVLSAPNQSTTYRHLFGANLQVDSSDTFTTPTANISGGGWEYLPANSLNAHGHIRYLSASDTNATTSTPVERLRIDATGRLLIGSFGTSTNSDSYVQAFKPTGNEATIVVGNEATSASGLCRYDFAPSNKVVGARIECHATEDFSTGANRTADLVFITRKDGTLSEKLRINSTGKVLVGSGVTDASLLNVKGNAGFADDGTNAGIIISTDDANGAAIHCLTTGGFTNGSYGIMRFNAVQHKFTYGNTQRLLIDANGLATFGGEIAAAQQYPDFRPTVDFNFAAEKKLDPRITHERTGPASFVNEFGKVVLVGDNVPRFDHDPITRECKGLVIEESKTNINAINTFRASASGTRFSINSADEQNAGENTNGVVSPVGTAKGVVRAFFTGSETAPDGSVYVMASTSGSDGAIFANSNTHTSSVWIRTGLETVFKMQAHANYASASAGGSASTIDFTFTLTGDGTVTSIESGGIAASVTKYPNNWYRCTLTYHRNGTSSVTSAYGVIVYPVNHASYNANSVSGDIFWVWGPQVEESPFPTSYIPTYGTTVTRGRDELTMSGSDLTDVFNNEEGTMFYEASLGDLTNDNQPIVAFRDLGTTTANYHAMGFAIGGSNPSIRTWFKSSSNNEHLSAHTSTGLTANMFYKHIYGYKDADCADAYRTPTNSGILSNQVGNGSPMIAAGVVDELRFGGYYAYESQPVTYGLDAGHIKRFSYWPQKLTNAQLTTYIS